MAVTALERCAQAKRMSFWAASLVDTDSSYNNSGGDVFRRRRSAAEVNNLSSSRFEPCVASGAVF